MEIGLLLLRVVVGALFVGHGTQKLLGWIDGPGIDGTTGMFGSLGYRQPRRMAVLAGLAETGAGLLLLLGLLTPFAAAAIIGVMLNAIVSVHLPNGPWVSEGGYEYNLVLMTVAAALAFAGPGVVSVDAALPWDLSGIAWGVTALLLGLLVGMGVLSARTSPEAVETEEPARADAESRRAA